MRVGRETALCIFSSHIRVRGNEERIIDEVELQSFSG
jgi:hypothetical protein